MKSIVILCVTLVCLLTPSVSWGGSVTLTFSPPTLNEDGTPLTDLDGYKFYYGTVQGGPYPTVEVSNNAGISSYVILGLSEGTYYIVATAFNTAGVESVYSNEATKVIPATAPAPPFGLTVQDLVAYTVVKIKNEFRLIAVGTVPVGTVCNPNQSVNGFYAVPTEAVQWSATVRDIVVVARCS